MADSGPPPPDTGPPDSGVDGGQPTDTPVVTAADPSSVAQGSTLVLTGERLADPTSVTIGGTEQTVSASTATSITIEAVADTTPTGTQPIVVTTEDGASDSFDVTVLAPLEVTMAVASSATSVVVTFSRDLDASSVDAESFTIDGLDVTDASVSGAAVTLTTSAQTADAEYDLSVSRDVTDTFGNALTGVNEAVLVGFDGAAPVITSVAPMHVVPGASMLTITGTNLASATVTIGGAAQLITSGSSTEIVIGQVAASTPLGAQPVVATRGGLDSVPVDVNVVDAFRIVSATSTSATTVEVEFNRDVHAPVTTAARFTISGGLTVTGATVAGDTVTLTTATQTPSATYTVGADSMLTDTNGIPVTADTAAFTGFVPPPPSEFVVVRVGDGTTAITDPPAVSVFLERRSIATGVLIDTIPLPTTASGANVPFVLSGRSTDGALSRSDDGRFLALAGYQVPGSANVQGDPTARVIAVISADDFAAPAGVDTSTTLGMVFSGAPIRAAVVDGTQAWFSAGFGGVYTTTIGSTTGGTRIANTAPSVIPSAGRTIAIFDGQLYSTTNTAPAGLYQIGTGLPTTVEAPATLLAATAEPYGFAVFDVDPGVPGPDRIYLADSAAGVLRFRRVGASWVHTAAEDVFGPPVRFLACTLVDTDVTCVGTNTSGTAVLRMTDEDASTPGSATAFTSIASAAPMTGFRGVAIAPVP